MGPDPRTTVLSIRLRPEFSVVVEGYPADDRIEKFERVIVRIGDADAEPAKLECPVMVKVTEN